MTSTSDFQNYLQSLCTFYKEWWKENAFIDEIRNNWFEFILDGKTKSDNSVDKQRMTDKQRLEPILTLIEDGRHQKTLVVGKPGAGKSTLLKRLLRDAAKKAKKDNQALIPVLVELKNYKTAGDRAGIRGLILESLESHDPTLDEEALKQLLTGKRLLLLADGLNELSYEPAKAELKNLCRHQSIIATSRFENSWWDINHLLEIQPLTPQQVKRFLEKRLSNRDCTEVEKLGERVRDFGQTPLMVWMLYSLFEARKEIPTTRGEAYRTFTALYVERAKTGSDLAESRFLLSKLAFEMMQSQKPNDPTHFSLDMTEVDAQNCLGSAKNLNQLLNFHLLQVSGQPGNRKFRFCHQTLQEYYAAEALLEQLQKHPEWLEKTPKQKWTQFQQDYLNYVKWTESISLMIGLPELTDTQILQIVKMALLEENQLVGAKLAGSAKPNLHTKTIKLIFDLKNLLMIKIKLLGLTKSSEAVSYLSTILNSQNMDFQARTAAIDAIEDIGGQGARVCLLEASKNDINPTLRPFLFSALGKIAEEYAIPSVSIESYTSSLLQERITQYQNSIPLSQLIQELQDEKADVRFGAALLLGRRGDKSAIPALRNKLDDSDWQVIESAVNALGKIAGPETLPDLHTLLLSDALNANLTHAVTTAIAAIQSRCGFYSHEVYQLSCLEASSTALRKQLNQGVQNVTNITINDGANVGAVNVDNIVYGSQNGINYNYTNDENLKQEISELRQLVSKLQQVHQPATEAEALQIIDAKFNEIQKNSPSNWQLIRKQLYLLKGQLLNPERHLQAGKAVITEIAKHYFEDSVVAKAVITYIDTMTMDTNQDK